ncbi:MAG: hypothetical protein AAFQ22_01255 [Pseudomonadota bacterium]
MANVQSKSQRRRRASSPLGVYGSFSLTSALVYCVRCLADAVTGERVAETRRAPGTVNAMNGDFARVSAGR